MAVNRAEKNRITSTILPIFILITLLSTSYIVVSDPIMGLQENNEIPTRSNQNIEKYYVDPFFGDDDNTGTSMALNNGTNGPWKTLKNIDEQTTFDPGAIIHLKTGGEWDLSECHDGYFTFRDHGTKGNPITITSYGNGPKPKLNGNWKAFVDIRGDYVTLSNLEIFNLSSGVVTQNPNAKHYGVTIKDNYIHHVGRWGVYAPYGEFDLLIHNNTITDTGLTYGGSGIAVMGDGNFHGSNIELSHNRIIRAFGDSITLHEGDSTLNTQLGTNFSIHNNYIYGSINADGIDITTGSQVRIFDNYVENCTHQLIVLDSSAHDIEVFNNRLIGRSPAGMVQISVRNVSFFGNVVDVNGGSTACGLNVNSVNYHSQLVNNINIFRNTFVYDSSMTHPGLVVFADRPGTLGTINFNSNILTSRSSSIAPNLLHFQYDSYPASDSSFSCDGNFFDSSLSSFNIRDRSNDVGWNQWRTTFGHDNNGYIGDPSLSWGSNFTYSISESSNCIDNGVNINSISWIRDQIKNPVYGEIDIGAIEFIPPYILGHDEVNVKEDFMIFSDGRFNYADQDRDGTKIDFSFEPLNGWTHSDRVDSIGSLNIMGFNPYSDRVIEWRENFTETYNSSYRISGLLEEERFTIFCDGNPINVSKSDSDGNLTFTLIKEYSDSIYYITREDKPILIKDSTMDEYGTGDNVDFQVLASDMDGIESINVLVYSEDNLIKENISLVKVNGTVKLGEWSNDFNIPNDWVGTINYCFVLVDIENVITITKESYFYVKDREMPILIADSTQNVMFGSEYIEFRVSISDNIGINSSYIQIIDNELDIEYEMVLDNEEYVYDHYIKGMKIDSIHYKVKFEDMNDNWNVSTISVVEIIDLIPPVLVSDNSDVIASTGDVFHINITYFDDFSVNQTRIEYSINNEDFTYITNEEKMDMIINIPDDGLGLLEYHIYAEDPCGNINSLIYASIPIIDNDPPMIITDDFITRGQDTLTNNILIAAEVVDNIQVDDVSVIINIEGESYSYSMDYSDGYYQMDISDIEGISPGNQYEFYLSADDLSGNLVLSEKFNLSIPTEDDEESNNNPEKDSENEDDNSSSENGEDNDPDKVDDNTDSDDPSNDLVDTIADNNNPEDKDAKNGTVFIFIISGILLSLIVIISAFLIGRRTGSFSQIENPPEIGYSNSEENILIEPEDPVLIAPELDNQEDVDDFPNVTYDEQHDWNDQEPMYETVNDIIDDDDVTDEMRTLLEIEAIIDGMDDLDL